MNRYISDLHFGHKNALKFDNRPFHSIDEMKIEIIKRWNNVVSKNDNVYILGDMFWTNEGAIEILEELKGNLFLVLGNHDRINSDMEKYFVWCDKTLKVINDGNQKVVLCHYPIACWQGQEHNPPTIHLYGHIHKGRDLRPYNEYEKIWSQRAEKNFLAANVGCMIDYMDYTPRTLNEIIKAKGW